MKNYEITYARITPTNDDIRISTIFIRPDNLKEAEKTFEKFVKDEKNFLSNVHSPFKILADFDRKNHSCKFYKVNDSCFSFPFPLKGLHFPRSLRPPCCPCLRYTKGTNP